MFDNVTVDLCIAQETAISENTKKCAAELHWSGCCDCTVNVDRFAYCSGDNYSENMKTCPGAALKMCRRASLEWVL